jgi:hypothetical protein
MLPTHGSYLLIESRDTRQQLIRRKALNAPVLKFDPCAK